MGCKSSSLGSLCHEPDPYEPISCNFHDDYSHITYPTRSSRHTPQSTFLPDVPDAPASGAAAVSQSQFASSPYEDLLARATHDLQHDFVSGARQLADKALQHLLYIIQIAACDATSPHKLRQMIVQAAKQLCSARPSMSAAIKSCLLRTLELVSKCWEKESSEGRNSTAHYGRVATDVLKSVIQKRKGAEERLNANFEIWLKQYLTTKPVTHTDSAISQTIRLLTLSNSSTIRSALLHILAVLPNLHIHIHILESRPRCEAINLASHLISSTTYYTPSSRLTFEIYPDSAVGLATRNIDIVLLGADCILANGDVSNKIGSLAAALCAKWHHLGTKSELGTRIVVLSDSDKIAGLGYVEPEREEHPACELSAAWDQGAWEGVDGLEWREEVKVNGEWFEWVNATLVDVYVMEIGVLGLDGVEKVSVEIGELERGIFGSAKG